eukprot:6837449-Pyramimonas_sp.AAC.1
MASLLAKLIQMVYATQAHSNGFLEPKRTRRENAGHDTCTTPTPAPTPTRILLLPLPDPDRPNPPWL